MHESSTFDSGQFISGKKNQNIISVFNKIHVFEHGIAHWEANRKGEIHKESECYTQIVY